MDDFRTLNRANWDERAPAHAASPDYAFGRFVDDPEFISDVVRFDLPRLGDLSGLRGVHLQCHIGTDTLSLSRLGAQMSGLDFSPASVAHARRLARAVGAGIDFVEADVYDAAEVLGREAFDLVFTGIGALCWLPDIRRWAGVVAGLLVVDYPYFERDEPMIFEEAGTYVQTDVAFTQNLTHSWNHGLGEIVSALVDAGMDLTMLVEHDCVPWDALPGQMEPIGGGEHRLKDRPWRVPHTYTLQAVKRPSPTGQ